MSARDLISLRRRPGSESGQATTEFALILFPFLILVAGIIWFGIGLNYWLDMQRLANQGARWAAVNQYPGCTTGTSPCNPTLQQYIACQPVAKPLKPSVYVSLPDGPDRGNSVEVELTTPFKFVPILGIGTIQLDAKATMRLEQSAQRFTSNTIPVTCP